MDDLQRRDVYSYPGSSPDLSIPGICEGYLMKKRKYPLKGWHKVNKDVFFYSVYPSHRQVGQAVFSSQQNATPVLTGSSLLSLKRFTVIFVRDTSCWRKGFSSTRRRSKM